LRRPTGLPENSRLHQKIAEKELAMGIYFVSGNPMYAEVLAQTGLDFVIIDTEHGPLGPVAIGPLARVCRTFRSYGVTPIVRIPSVDEVYIGKVLDAGALGILAPRMQTADDMRALVTATLYAPRGTRGAGDLTPSNQYVGEPHAMFNVDSDLEQVLVAPLMEHIVGVDNFEEISDVPGISFVRVGKFDLARSMGLADRYHPDVEAARQRVMDICHRKGIPVGESAHTTEKVQNSLAAGHFILTVVDEPHMLFETCKSQVAMVREVATGLGIR
jgi:2-keto-3-deoxy-L-rhamnonate aldolase RhmA